MIQLYFDGACRKKDIYASEGITGIGVHIIGIKNFIYTGKSSDTYDTYENTGIKTNNQAEYLALIEGLRILLQVSIPKNTIINIYGDSLLVVNQVSGLWKCKSDNLTRLNINAKQLLYTMNKEYNVSIKHVLRDFNKIADALSNKGVEDV
jgi:ribonuclease HI